MTKALVVGSGPNGLAAALVLARSGWDVDVHEAQATAGGGMRSLELTLPGFVHDVCSAIHPLAVGSPYLRTLPLAEHGLDWVHPDAPCAHPFDDGTAAVCERSVAATADGLGAEGEAWQRLFEPLVRGFDAITAELLTRPLHVPRRPAALLPFLWAAKRSARGIARRHLRGERARALFAGMAAHSVQPLEALASGAFGLFLAASAHAVGWPMPRGGAQSLADALIRCLRASGGTVHTGRRVDSLAEIDRDTVVLLDVAPRAAERIAGERFDAGYRRRLRRYRHGPGAFKLDWALDGPIPWRAAACRRAATVHLGGTFDEIARGERTVWEGGHPEQPFVLLAQHTPFDPTRAPEGRHTAWAYCHVPNGSATDMTERIEAQVERFAPGFGKRILARSALSARELEAHDANLVGGDFSGGRMDLRQLLWRPRLFRNPYATPDPHVFLCSASTPPGGGAHGMCGYHAARTVLRRLGR